MRGTAKGCVVGAGVVLVLATTTAAVLLPGMVRRLREFSAPLQQMRSAQQDFESWSRQHPWHEPVAPTVSAEQLDRFLALRRELQQLEEDAPRPRREPGDPRPRFEDVPKIVGGVSGYVSARLEAFKRAGMTNAEYRYLDRLVYRRWLPALRGGGQDPAVLEQVSREILNAAHDEADPATAARLRVAAQKVRQRRPGPPAGIPEDVHALFLGRANEIESLSGASTRRPVPDAP